MYASVEAECAASFRCECVVIVTGLRFGWLKLSFATGFVGHSLGPEFDSSTATWSSPKVGYQTSAKEQRSKAVPLTRHRTR
jgi:hypothetical protein